MKFFAAILTTLVLASELGFAARLPDPADDYRQLSEIKALPSAPDPAFEFRKTKTFLLGGAPGIRRASGLVSGAPKDPAIGFESSYRFFGAVTGLDQRARIGHYFDFFWRSKQPAKVTVRLEYRQEKLRSATQAREVSYQNARGNTKTSFAVVGEDFYTDGRILSWRCLLIVNGKIVAEDRSYLWR